MTKPLISVLLPVFNASRYLQTALDSVAAQTCADFELIAVDDGSADDSLAILRRHAAHDSRTIILSRPNTGIVGALNHGLALARGEFVARMDADDVALPARFAAQVSYLRAHAACVAVGSDILYLDPEGAPIERHRPALDHAAILAQLLEGNGGALIHPSTLLRRAALAQVGGYHAGFNLVEDLDLYLRLATLGQLANLPDVFLHYRQHPQNTHSTHGSREALRLELVNPHRLAAGLPLLTADPANGVPPPRRADWRRQWAYNALRGGHQPTARKNAWRACFTAPHDLRNWQCLRYTFTAPLPSS